MGRISRRTALLAATSIALAACTSDGAGGGDTGQVGGAATVSHIHGLGVDARGTLFVATHFGLIEQASDGSFVYASADQDDYMGFSLHPGDGVMYRSGHSPSNPRIGVESSTDGARWTHLSDVADPPVDFHAMAVSFADSKTLWGWDSGGRGTFRSTDGGKEWTRVAARGIEPQTFTLAGPAEANLVLAGTASGLYRSADGGAAWQPVRGASSGWVIGVAADPNDAKRLLASTQEGVKASLDGGTTWQAAGGGLPGGAQIAYLAISPADGNVAYAADSSRIHRTSDGGKRWSQIYPAS